MFRACGGFLSDKEMGKIQPTIQVQNGTESSQRTQNYH